MNISKTLAELIAGCPLLSRSKLARDMGVHTSTVTNWLNGAQPKIERLVELAAYFGVSLDELIAEREK